MKDIKPLNSVSANSAKPFAFATQAQYQRYIDCLNREGLSGISVVGGFTTDQLRCAIKAMGTCPPGYQSKCSGLYQSIGYDTPIINPAPGFNPTGDYNSAEFTTESGKKLSGSKGRRLSFHRGRYVSTYGNDSGPSQPAMTGFNFMPATFKDRTKTFIDPKQYGFEAEILPGRFVSATHQRITDGKIVPLKEPLQVISRQPRVIKNVNLPEEQWVNVLRNLQNINETTKGTLVTPPKISGVANINGRAIQNIKTTADYLGYPLDEVVWPGPDGDEILSTSEGGAAGGGGDLTGGGAAGGSGRSGRGGAGGAGGGAGGGSAQFAQFSPYDSENIRYNPYPVVDITPLEMDSSGNYYNGGPTARAQLKAPTPEATINQQDLMGIPANSELVINGKKIIIRGVDLADIKNQVNCAKAGVIAELNPGDTGAGAGGSLTISSCDGSPWSVANGCGGGTYKQVGDFHINRGFEQQQNTSRTLSNSIVIAPSSVSGSFRGTFYKDNSGTQTGTTREIPKYTENAGKTAYFQYKKDLETGLYSLPTTEDGEIDYNNPLTQASFKSPAIVPMETTSKQSTYTTGGSGYRIGDRLRLVGGTPVNNSTGPLTKICIDSAGAGYTNPANLQIIINADGDVPGTSAVAAVTRLDEIGGIAEIEMISYGGGYDTKKPPTVEIYDSTPSSQMTSTTVLASWTADVTTGQPISIAGGQTVQIEAQRKIYDNNRAWDGVEISHRYVRATRPLTFGQTNSAYMQINSVEGGVAWSDPAVSSTYLPNRAEIQIDTTVGTWAESLRPNSEVEIIHFPMALFHTANIALQAGLSDGANLVIDYDATLWNNVLSFGGHHVAVYASTTGDSNVQLIGHAGYDYADTAGGTQIDFGQFELTAVFDTDGAPSSSWAGTLTAGTDVFISVARSSRFWIPEPVNSTDGVIFDNKFIIEDPVLSNALKVASVFQAHTDIKVTTTTPWWTELLPAAGSTPALVDTIDPRIPRISAKLSAMIGMDPNINYSEDSGARADEASLLDRSFAGPLRIAKFIVTGVDELGTITAIKVIDRGLYSVFPGDLTFGIPLEYDYEPQGFAKIIPGEDIVSLSNRLKSLGVVDPFRKNAEYGSSLHPEYLGVPFVNSKHPDWTTYPEFWYDGTTYQPYSGSPGAYDPSTFVIVNTAGVGSNPIAAEQAGLLLRKQYDIETDPGNLLFGRYSGRDDGTQLLTTPGGTGARLFLTSQDVPNCTEKGRAKENLNLPDVVAEINAPKALARSLNNALTGAGYSPTDVNFKVDDFGDIGVIRVETDFPGLNMDSPTPGILEKLGLPSGDYNLGMLCTEVILENPDLSDAEALEVVKGLYEAGNFGILTDPEEIQQFTGTPREFVNPTAIINMLCVERMGPNNPVNPPPPPPPGSGGITAGGPPAGSNSRPGSFTGPYPLNDNNSIFHDGKPQVYAELYKYKLTNIFGEAIKMNGSQKQSAPVNIFESKRFNDSNPIDILLTDDAADTRGITAVKGLPSVYTEANAWVDSYRGLGWAYLENGEIKAHQQDLVDTQFIDNALVYDPETGSKVTQLDFWDPFKGILPGFIRNEIHYITEQDPVSYKNDRTVFGRNNVGKVWWDTSTIRYEWYEQGSNTERRNKWGKAFPGSSVTVCEWVESKSLPTNWAGNGIPRWRDRYVTERHRDERTGEYQLYYYYWVQNRKLVDDRLKEKWNRKFDTQTLARYIANPAGYGLDLVSFVSDNSFVLSNPGQYISDKDSHVQINVSRNSNPDSLKHTAWKLMREGDNNSQVPDHLTAKLIDSLSGINAIGEAVPDPRLSVVEAYGISFRPRQSMFQDVREARRVAVRVINELLADIKLNTQYPEWDSALPTTRSYIQTVNWYAVDKYDPVTNMAIRYDNSYKPVTKVPSVTELYKLKNLADGTVVQVASAQNNTSQLWLYNSNQNDFKLISIANETVQLSDSVYTDITNPTLSLELRTFLITMSQKVLSQGTEKWNTVFFELLKYAYMEQSQLSWAFKTSYLYVEKQEDDLVQFKGFKPDNFQKVLDYMTEVKPFNSKIREYKDGKTAPMEIIGQNNISDYDKPPYVDTVTGEVRILDDFLQEDYDIMRNNARYIDYLSVSNKSQDPIRRANTTLVFDRTNWRLTEFNWNASSTPVNLSIATNIAALTQMTGAEVEAATTSRAVDRIFKFAPAVRAAFALEVNNYFNSPTAYSNADIVGNVTQMYNIIEAGQLNNTLALVKDLVGGNFRGETIDGKQFTTIMQNIDYMANAAVEFGFDTVSWDENTDNDVTVFTDSRNQENYGNVISIGIGDVQWDSTLELVSYEGVFNTETQGNVTLRRNDETYEGFDGVTFQRVLYGEERPEEMALFDPLETLVMTVTTSEFARGSTLTNTIYDEFDLANSTLYYQAVSAANVTIINPGAGYVNPTVTFFDDGELRTPAAINTPITVATGNAVVDANGLITAITLDSAGSGYVSIGVRVSETLSAFTAAEGVRGINELVLTSTNNARVGQRVRYAGTNLGVIASIDGTTLILDRGLPLTVPNAIEISLSGQDFVGAVETAKATLAGPDADLTAIYFIQNSVTGWDSANIDGEAGAFDVDRETAQEVVSIKVSPQAQEVVYRTHMNLFGGTDYLRIAPTTTTTLVEDFGMWDTEIQLTDASFLPYPTTQQPGTLWLGSERINYARRNGNTLSLITRGVLGTTIEDHAAGDAVYSAESGDTFNDLNPRGNIWLDLGTKYNTPSAWSEVEAGIDGVLGTVDDIIHAWDELANGNITVSTVSANIIDANSTTSNITLLSSMTLTVDEAVRITHASNVNLTEVVKVTNIDGNNVTVEASYFGTLDANLFVANSTVQFSSFDYGTQASEDAWDAAVISGQSALSLADRANIDFTANTSIMRFLHNL